MTGLAGEITSREAWELLKSDPDAVLIDVRTQAEWDFVGVCDLSAIDKNSMRVSWQVYPGMAINPNFDSEVMAAAPGKDAALLFICRSGIRSLSAASSLAAQGYTRCFNVSDGFEGDPDGNRHRGLVNGWRASGLPWLQQ